MKKNNDMIVIENFHELVDPWDNKYFSPEEIACKESGILAYDERFLDAITQLRIKCDFPFTITSWYRHESHSIEKSKKEPGVHCLGLACDIAVDRERAFIVLKEAMAMGCFLGIGFQQKGSNRFIHLDMASAQYGILRPTIWSY
tara:strand:+ start:776 stop:1207 length:432 start_codon:yes stop_codon:yes gene_type:complete